MGHILTCDKELVVNGPASIGVTVGGDTEIRAQVCGYGQETDRQLTV